MFTSLPHLTQTVLVKSGCVFLLWSGEDCDLGMHIHQNHKSLILSPPPSPPSYLGGGVSSLIPLGVMGMLAPLLVICIVLKITEITVKSMGGVGDT